MKVTKGSVIDFHDLDGSNVIVMPTSVIGEVIPAHDWTAMFMEYTGLNLIMQDEVYTYPRYIEEYRLITLPYLRSTGLDHNRLEINLHRLVKTANDNRLTSIFISDSELNDQESHKLLAELLDDRFTLVKRVEYVDRTLTVTSVTNNLPENLYDAKLIQK